MSLVDLAYVEATERVAGGEEKDLGLEGKSCSFFTKNAQMNHDSSKYL